MTDGGVVGISIDGGEVQSIPTCEAKLTSPTGYAKIRFAIENYNLLKVGVQGGKTVDVQTGQAPDSYGRVTLKVSTVRRRSNIFGYV